MAGPYTALRHFRKIAFANYHAQIKRLLKERVRPVADESLDADYLSPDWTITKLLKSARDALAAHIARKDDPHKETINSINSYSSTEVMNSIGAKIPNSVVPVSSYGSLERLTASQVAAAWETSATGFKVTINRAIQAVLSGTVYTLPAGELDLVAAGGGDARNKTFNIMVRTRFGQVRYDARTDSPPETISAIYIGRIITDANGVTSKSIVPVVRIDTFRPSTSAIGSAMPVTGGTIDNITKLPATWNPL